MQRRSFPVPLFLLFLLTLWPVRYAMADFVVNNGRFTNVYVFPKPSSTTWEQYLLSLPASQKPQDWAQYTRQNIDSVTGSLMSSDWLSYFGALYQYGGINPPQFFGSHVASQKCVDAALKDLNNNVLQQSTVRSLANCHEDGMDPSPQVNLIFSPDIQIAPPSYPMVNGPDMCKLPGSHAIAYHDAGVNTPNFAVLPTEPGCAGTIGAATSFTSFTASLTHEVVEMLADPAALGHGGAGGSELGDQCQTTNTTWNGTTVQAYRSDNDNACWPNFAAGSSMLTWVLAQGSPVIRLTGDAHTLPLQVPAGRTVTDANATSVQIWIQTGSDDLRGGRHLRDDANVTLTYVGGSTLTTNINGGRGWGNGQTHFAELTLPAGGLPVKNIQGITLSTNFGGGIDGDNWNVDKVALIVSYPSGSRTYGPPGPRYHEWLDVSGGPLIRFTGSVHDLIVSVPLQDPGIAASAIDLLIATGNDDLRGGRHAQDNADATFSLFDGTSFTVSNINHGRSWGAWTENVVPIPLPARGLRGGDIRYLTLHTGFGGGVDGDNWNVQRVELRATIPPGPPVVRSISPSTADCTKASGTDVTITGTDFDGLTRVFIQSSSGATVPLTVKTKTSTTVTVTVPGNLAASEYEIVVQTTLGLSTQSPLGTRTDSFNIGPRIASLDPDHGPIAGGTPVTLHGSCFSTGGNGIQVTFGGKVAGLGLDQCVSHTECVVYSPPATTGQQVDVVFSVNGGRSAPGTKFTYTGPFISSLVPNHGPVTGGTDILIYGGGFPPDKGLPTNLPLTFGNVHTAARCTGNTVYETKVCSFTTPAVALAGPVQVVGTAYGVNSASSNASVFTFDPYPQIIKFVLPYPYPGLNPQSGLFLNGNAPSGGAAITVTSSDPDTLRADPQVVTIAPGRQWSDIALVTNPTSVAKHVTLVASYQGQSISAERDIDASPPLGIAPASQGLPFGVSQAVTVTLNTPAPIGGATVQVTADDPVAVGMVNPTLVNIPAGGYSARLQLLGSYTTKDLGKWIDLTAQYGVLSATTAVFASPPQPPAKPCKKKVCPKGYFQTPDGCGCQKGLPQ